MNEKLKSKISAGVISGLFVDKSNFFVIKYLKNNHFTHFKKTSMHSRRMRTAYLLTVSPSMHCAGGVCSWGVSAGGCLPLVPGGCVSHNAMGQTPPMDRILDTHF